MDRTTDFYVYLNSHDSNFKFPDNANYGFTNSMCPNITLTEEYEVALVNILFSPEFYTIRKGDPDYSIELFIEYTENIYFRRILILKYTPQNNLNSTSIQELIENIDKDLKSYLTSENLPYINELPIIKYDSKTSHVNIDDIKLDEKIYSNYRVTWTIAKSMKILLGRTFMRFNASVEKDINKAQYPKSAKSLLVYTDIVAPSSFSNQNVHLLDIVPMNGTFSKNGSLTIYKKVNRKHIDEISISIKNEYGQDAYFCEDVNIQIILHFRRSL